MWEPRDVWSASLVTGLTPSGAPIASDNDKLTRCCEFTTRCVLSVLGSFGCIHYTLYLVWLGPLGGSRWKNGAWGGEQVGRGGKG